MERSGIDCDAGMGEATASRLFGTVRWLHIARLRVGAAWPFSVRVHVVGFILAIVAPLLAFNAYLVLRSAIREQSITASSVRESTLEAVASLDHELGSLRSRLLTLAASYYLQVGDLAVFRDEATPFAKSNGMGVLLSDLGGQEIVDTNANADTPLPAFPDPEAIRDVVATGQPSVSNLARSALTGKPFIAINVPVTRDGKMTYVLSLDIAPILPRMLADLGLPAEWLVTIADRAGRTIGRSRESDRFVGQLGRSSILEHLRERDQGEFSTVSRDNIPIHVSFAHVRFSGWAVSVGIPDAVLYAPVRRSTLVLLVAGAATLLLALLLGTAIGRHIAGGIAALADHAEQVGRSDLVIRPSGIKEVDAVAQSLRLAGERLRQSAREREVLLRRTITAQGDERRRIARELHDSLGQYLTALRLGFGAIEPICATNPTAQERLTELKRLASNLGRELNRIAWELRPMVLDDLGLRRAVTQYLEEWSDRSGLAIDLEMNLDDGRLSQSVETALFRVLQEAIANVVKHSRAERVSVILETVHGELRLIVEDNGRSFGIDGTRGELELGAQRLGLIGVRERLALVGGSVEVESSAGGGTTIYVRIPV